MEKKIESIALIIPVYNEEKHLSIILDQACRLNFHSITVVDADSTDQSSEIARQFNVHYLNNSTKGRAAQMNRGALSLTAPLLLFLHADVCLPDNFTKKVSHTLTTGFTAASFQLRFTSNHWFLKLNSIFSRFNFLPFQFGDQGLLIKRDLFIELKGYDESLLFMEGNDLIRRIKRKHPFSKIRTYLTVSARKYEEHGVFHLQFTYYLIYLLSRLGISQQRLKKLFIKALR